MAEDVRKSQAALSGEEWERLIDAINVIHRRSADPPRYQDFVAVHKRAMSMAGMDWAVHTMGTMRGRNFLPWHRWFVRSLERRLQQVHPGVTIPYWDWVRDREIPRPLRDRALLRRWGVTRSWNAAELPERADVTWALKPDRFPRFQARLEFIHGEVHNAVGGDMAGPGSPGDPIFFLHHANVDRLWARWQERHPRGRPPNGDEELQPPTLFAGVKVRDVLRTSSLGYRYR